MVAKVVKATEAEKQAYAATGAVYPLHGWLNVTAYHDDKPTVIRCAVEDLRGAWSKPDPIYELMAPKGYWFVSSYTHSLLALSLRDVVSRVGGEHLEIEEVM